jgi:hypothetical protein
LVILIVTRFYKERDRLEAETVNMLIRRQLTGESLQSSGQESVVKDNYSPSNIIRVLPNFAVPAFSVFTVPMLATSFDFIEGKPQFNITDTVAGGLVATNGSVALTSGQPGHAVIMREGDFHWVRGPSGAKGHLGLNLLSSNNLLADFQGFMSVGSTTIDGVIVCHVTRIKNETYLGTATSAIPITGTGNVQIRIPSGTTWGAGTITVKAYTTESVIDSGKPVKIEPVDWRWYASELC